MVDVSSLPVGALAMVRSGTTIRVHEGRDVRGRSRLFDCSRPGAYGHLPEAVPGEGEGTMPFQVHGYIARHPVSRTEFMTTVAEGVDVVRIASLPLDPSGEWETGPGSHFVSIDIADVDEAYVAPDELSGLGDEGSALLAQRFGDGVESPVRILH
jgi:hypothetical protein